MPDIEDRPAWLDCRELNAAAEDILKKLDRQSADSRTRDIVIDLSKKAFNTLREPPEHGDDEWLWHQIQISINDGIFVFDYGRNTIQESVPTSGKLRFQPDKEDLLRGWLNHPRRDIGEDWRLALQGATPGALNTDFLGASKLQIDGMSADAIVEALQKAKEGITEQGPKTLRSIAATYFNGASKALDIKGEKWLSIALKVSTEMILPRKIFLNAFTLNPDTRDVLFVENLDTFEACCNHSELANKFILVYLAGYKGVSERIRSRTGLRIFVSGNCSQEVAEACIIDYSATNFFIWTDLDYAGLDIAIMLRRQYPELEFLESAYSSMMKLMDTGAAHPIGHATKGEQRAPKSELLWGVGLLCLEKINSSGVFVDQESVCIM